ncbi:hypothetical protein DSC45_24300 [Streptomyces sp. YIM 130001]|uniref:DUF3099 domain-containing protein n=1 Tax=Streptomyces sp. YIM 130001 TaxID=2259644 RepID=UPI000E658D4B|nr:DUF3099 domain-containing protein [Streptomyces sp. YIM 130001]RII13477.1 hypothetical protein DSC45_24300 [Streptomyces sp. YIM 130001]
MRRTPRGRDGPPAESITGARTSLTQDVRARQRRYIVAMLIRSVCVVVMALTWDRWPVLAVAALVGAVAIPYIAVVVAQAGWRQGRGARPELAAAAPAPATPVVLEPTLILPPEPEPEPEPERSAAG